MSELYEKIKNYFEISTTRPELPEYIVNNVKYQFFDWQKEALQYFLLSESTTTNKTSPTHLMFNMATGTGKTLIMASCILYYYKKGYRKFIFFVNQKNIIYKTENNFINNSHSKYLFTDKIVIDNETIDIQKVETFSQNSQSIEIKFTTIQQLYNDIHTQKENQVVLDDLLKKDIVMLADEGHHLNADTKKVESKLDFPLELDNRTSEAEVEKKCWEHTVIELLLNKNGKKEINKNVLLEFTATIPDNPKVIEKYLSKIIYKFSLREFLKAGYTKEINLLSSNLAKRERILLALLFSWYRHSIALKNNLSNWKPVILFRSKTIDESRQDFIDFLTMVDTLKVADFEFLKNVESQIPEGKTTYEQGKSRVFDLLKFIKGNGIHKSEIVTFIKENFSDRNCIITNSKTNKSHKKEELDGDVEQLLNNLEDKNNHIRAIFTVSRLTEGWDVLNLFDIVRLYSGRDESAGTKGNRKAGKATTSEIQLIGRGVRYYPFTFRDKIKNKRKFDDDLSNEMRVLEELYYHCDSEHKYIDELKRELKEKGLLEDDRIEKKFNIKQNFLDSLFYQSGSIWKNEQTENPERKKQTIDYFNRHMDLTFKINNLEIIEQEIDITSENLDMQRLNTDKVNKGTLSIKIKEFEKHIFYKAISIKAKKQNSSFRFDFLQQEMPIESLEDFRTKLIGNLSVNIITTKTKFEEITNKEKLNILLKALDIIFSKLKEHVNPYIGTDFQPYSFTDFFGDEVIKKVYLDNENQHIEDELKKEDWFVQDQFYGTSEEKRLIEFIQGNINNLKDKYEEVYLLRNEEQYKIYDFASGRGFQPDFILFLKDCKASTTQEYSQIFIESKGNHLLEHDQWKEDFLLEITRRYGKGAQTIKIENETYSCYIVGMPMFNNNALKKFADEFAKL